MALDAYEETVILRKRWDAQRDLYFGTGRAHELIDSMHDEMMERIALIRAGLPSVERGRVSAVKLCG